MKKRLSALLIVSMVFLTLMGCGSGTGTGNSSKEETTTAEAQASEVTEEATESANETTSETATEAANETTSETATEAANETLTETVNEAATEASPYITISGDKDEMWRFIDRNRNILIHSMSDQYNFGTQKTELTIIYEEGHESKEYTLIFLLEGNSPPLNFKELMETTTPLFSGEYRDGGQTYLYFLYETET